VVEAFFGAIKHALGEHLRAKALEGARAEIIAKLIVTTGARVRTGGGLRGALEVVLQQAQSRHLATVRPEQFDKPDPMRDPACRGRWQAPGAQPF